MTSDQATAEQTGSAAPSPLSPRALMYLLALAVATAVAAFQPLAELGTHAHAWKTFAVLGACAAVAQLFVVYTPRNQSYHTAIVFLVAAALLLPPAWVALIALVQHVPEWLKERYPWYIQGFNICNFSLSALTACGLALAVERLDVVGADARAALAGVAASLVFVAINHTLLAVMLRFARGHSFRQSGLFSFESLSTDLVLAGLGLALVVLWRENPFLAVTAVAPLLLIHRALAVPALAEQARLDGKTGLFNVHHFAAAAKQELERARRFERPLSLIMADLDLLRNINNSYGHLAGDAVLRGVADVFRRELRDFDVPARFGGEEFAILLPETDLAEALAIGERIRACVAETPFDVETAAQPIRATVSVGVASLPGDGADLTQLIHQADVAVYRAKLQGRNRVLAAGAESLADPGFVPSSRLSEPGVTDEHPSDPEPASTLLDEGDSDAFRALVAEQPRPSAPDGPRLLALSPLLVTLVLGVAVAGVGGGLVALASGGVDDVIRLLAVVALIMGGQALALELEGASISVSAVGALAAAGIFGPRASLLAGVAIAAVAWSAARGPLYRIVFNAGALTLSVLAAAGVFAASGLAPLSTELAIILAGPLAGAAYFVVNTGLTSAAMAVEGKECWRRLWRERFAWLLPHYLGFGAVGSAITLAVEAIGLFGLIAFALPLVLMRKTMADYLGHTQASAKKLRQAAETIRIQNRSLTQANRLLKERSTAAMASLSATVDARDAYTAGHSRRVQELALAVGRELQLTEGELDLLAHAAVFHDIGKLGIPDEILLKPGDLSDDEWALMRRHSEEGASIIDRLGFLADSVPAIRHHHERFDGTGYPDGLAGEDIPIGARIIHLADALDSMLSDRVYRCARPLEEAFEEIAANAGTQFCPRCVAALERVVAGERFPEIGRLRPFADLLV